MPRPVVEILARSTPTPPLGLPGRGRIVRRAHRIHTIDSAFSDGGPPMQNLWTKCLGRVRDEVSPQAFERWFSGTRPVVWEGGTITVEAPDPFSLDTLRTRYSGLVESILRQESGEALSLRWAAAANGAPPALAPRPAAPAPPAGPPAQPDFLNPNYT